MRITALWLIIAAPPVLPQRPDFDQILALAKTFFRDSAELPMVVATLTTVTRPNGSVQKERHGNVRMIFHGYSKTGDFTVNVRGGIFEKGLMLNSLNADMAAFFSGSMLLQNRGTAKIRIEMPRVFLDDSGCSRYQPINERVLFPKKDTLCGHSIYTLDGEGDGLRFKSYQFTASNLPVHTRTAELGEVDIRGFEIYATFQEWRMPGESEPFLIPKSAAVTVTTGNGEIRFRNDYTPQPGK